MADAARLFLWTFDRLYLACLKYGAVLDQEDASAHALAVEKMTLSLGGEIDEILHKSFDAPHGLPPKLTAEIQYALAALIDELLIHEISWAGREAWFQNLVERKLFRTAVAGRRVFQNIDSLQDRYFGNPHQKSMAYLYLMLLHLGFRGELRARPEQIRTYQAYLADLADIPKGSLEPIPGISPPVFPQAYEHSIVNPQGQRLSSMRHWWAWGLAALVGYLIVTTIGWYAVLWQWQLDVVVPAGAGPSIGHVGESAPPTGLGALS